MKRITHILVCICDHRLIELLAQEPATNPDRQIRKSDKAEKKEANAADKGKSMSLTGWVKDQDGKTVFINDKDKQAWNI